MSAGPWSLAALLCAVTFGSACSSKPREAKPEAAPMPSAASAPLECTLSVAPSVRAGEPMMLRFQLTNRGAQPLYVLDWHTPLEGLLANMLQVSRAGGAELPYQGPMAKRGNPTAEDYRTLAPGASVEGEIDVGLAYETGAPGRYRIAFRGPLMDVAREQAGLPRPLDHHEPMPVSCAPVETERLAP
jgi:peptidyl-Lys metalloendopeptidase